MYRPEYVPAEVSPAGHGSASWRDTVDNGMDGAILMLRHLDPDGVAEVLRRLLSSEGIGAVTEGIRRTPVPGDAFVSGVLAVGVPEFRRALAACPQLTVGQVRCVLRGGGPDRETTAALFPNRRVDSAIAPTRPLPSEAALSGPAAAESALLDERCPDTLADEILDRFPHLAYVLRNQHPGYVRFLRGDHGAVGSLTAGELVHVARYDGGLGLADIVRDLRPASSALSALAGLAAGKPWLMDELRAVVGRKLAGVVGDAPGLLRELDALGQSFEGSIDELLDAVGNTPGDGGAYGGDADERTTELCFLALLLPGRQLVTMLPGLPGDVRERLGRDAATADAVAMTELALATRDTRLLCGLASRTVITPEATARLVALDDAAVNRALVSNRAVEPDVRHNIFVGIPQGRAGERLSLDPELQKLGAFAEPRTLVASGDPALALRALTGRPRLRAADRVAVAIALWERGGGDYLGRVPEEVFGVSVGRLVSAAVMANRPEVLYEARERQERRAARASANDKSGKAATNAAGMAAVGPYDASFAEHSGQFDTMMALEHGRLTPEQAMHEVAPARHTVHAFRYLTSSAGPNPVDGPLSAYVRKHLDGPHRADAWAVLVRLLPEFEGTLEELLVVCSAVAA